MVQNSNPNINSVGRVDSIFAGDNDYKRVTGRYPWEPEKSKTTEKPKLVKRNFTVAFLAGDNSIGTVIGVLTENPWLFKK